MPFLGPLLDAWLHHGHPSQNIQAAWPAHTHLLDTPSGRVRCLDTGGRGPALVMVPDGPCVIEHYEALIARLAHHFRVVCFDMPGFGFSYPSAEYDHGLRSGAQVLLDVLNALQLERVALSFTCANGFYALQAARQAPDRISQLVLAQTPSLGQMHHWVGRVIPRPLRVPGLGQVLTRVAQRRLAIRWYRGALPRSTDPQPFEQPSAQVLASGGCFCLAGVVQGLLREHPAVALPPIEDVPITLVWGTLDRSHRSTNPASLREHAPQAALIAFPDCGHFPNLEQPARFAGLLRATLL